MTEVFEVVVILFQKTRSDSVHHATVRMINTFRSSGTVVSHESEEKKWLSVNQLPEEEKGGIRTGRCQSGQTEAYRGGESECNCVTRA